VDKFRNEVAKRPLLIFFSLLFLLYGFNCLDYFFTMKVVFGKEWVLAHPQYETYEGNPVARWFISYFGPSLGLSVFKILIGAIFTPCLISLYNQSPKTAFKVLGFACFGYLLLNIYQIYLAYFL